MASGGSRGAWDEARTFWGEVFAWQGSVETQPHPVAPLSAAPVFAVVDQTVFEVVADDRVIEFSLAS